MACTCCAGINVELLGDYSSFTVMEDVHARTGAVTYTFEGTDISGCIMFYPIPKFSGEDSITHMGVVSGMNPTGRNGRLYDHLNIEGVDVEFAAMFHRDRPTDLDFGVPPARLGFRYGRSGLSPQVLSHVSAVVWSIIAMWEDLDSGELMFNHAPHHQDRYRKIIGYSNRVAA
jgi:hypothetical protein